MAGLIIDYLRDDNASLRAELVRRFEQAEALKKTLADTAEALRLYVDRYAVFSEMMSPLRKENEGLKKENEAWKKEREEIKGKLTSVEQLIDALKKENARLESVWKTASTLLSLRTVQDKFPAQMNESAKWTGGVGAAQWEWK